MTRVNAYLMLPTYLQSTNFVISLSWPWKFTVIKSLGSTETTSMDKNVVVCKNLSPELFSNLAKMSEGEMFARPRER